MSVVTILLIEDNLAIRENTCELLELAGYRVIEAIHGKMGLEFAQKEAPDLILCDIMMPEMNGYEVYNRLKENEETASIPFIFVTASAEPKEMLIGLEMGANAYIRKPFHEDELLNAVQNCLNSASQ